MSSAYKVKQSREQWKKKACCRGDDNRYLRKELRRIKNERDVYKTRAKEAEVRLKAPLSPPHKLPAVASKIDVVFMALQLFVVARIGFRAVSRVLGVLGAHLGITQAPCPQTVINWVRRLSMARLRSAAQRLGVAVNGDRSCKGLIWMIDTSIALGTGKILAVIALQARHHHDHPGAPSFANVHCIAVAVAASWTGESIADFLQQVIGVMGRPVAYLKDGGKDLAKAVNLLGERGLPSLSIDDISHVMANLLKHEYVAHPLFDTFISACGKVAQHLKQTVLACLAPPKNSTKARFMNLHRLVRWADRLLKHSPVGRAAQGSALAKLRASLDRLPACKAFIHRFLRDATPLLECQKHLKVHGLSHTTSQQCVALIEPIPPSSPVRIGFTHWLEKQLQVAQSAGLADHGLPISSDPLESLFGLAKQHGVGEIKDAHRIAIHLPALCGPLRREDAQCVLDVSVAQQHQLTDSVSSLTQQRRELLPNPGTLENIAHSGSHQYLELIPSSKNRSKSRIIVDRSKHYETPYGPLPQPEMSAPSPLNRLPIEPPRPG